MMTDTHKSVHLMTVSELLDDGWTVFAERDILKPEMKGRKMVTLKKDGMTQVRVVK